MHRVAVVREHRVPDRQEKAEETERRGRRSRHGKTKTGRKMKEKSTRRLSPKVMGISFPFVVSFSPALAPSPSVLLPPLPLFFSLSPSLPLRFHPLTSLFLPLTGTLSLGSLAAFGTPLRLVSSSGRVYRLTKAKKV